MMLSSKRAALILFVGDLVLFVFSLWLSLTLRTLSMPSYEFFMAHVAPFSLLFLVWVGTFFIAGLYETRSIVLAKRSFSTTLLWTQNINILIAALFFFFVSIYGIAPKTILVIYLITSYLLILAWRVVLFPRLGIHRVDKAIALGRSVETHELVEKLVAAKRSPVRVIEVIDPGSANATQQVLTAIAHYKPKYIIVDFTDPLVEATLPPLQPLLANGILFYNTMSLYEEVFGRVPLAIVNDRWLAQYASKYSHPMYDSFKRAMDIVIAGIGAVLSLVFYPFLYLAVTLYDGGPVFYRQIRTGQNNEPFAMNKFRSMSGTDNGSEVLKSKHVVTPVGKVIRKTRVDEIPQLWSVIKGDLSLIGPRPEFPALVEEYATHIPHYNIRHLIKPGLSGWAQLYHDNHPHHGTEVEATREKLSYDLYYLKHRSLILDFIIGLKTIKKLITRSGA